MVFLGVAVILIATSEEDAKEELGDVVNPDKISILWPIFFVVINAVVHTCVTVTGRLWMLKGGIPSFNLTTDAYLWHVITLMIAQLVYSLVYEPLPSSVIFFIAVGSMFNMTGFFLCTEACVYGKAGPAQALMELQSIWQLLLEVVIYSNIPNIMQIIAMGFALVGSIVVAVETDPKEEKADGVKESLLTKDEQETKDE